MDGGEWTARFADTERVRRLELKLMAENKNWEELMQERLALPTLVEPQLAYELSDKDRILLTHYGIAHG